MPNTEHDQSTTTEQNQVTALARAVMDRLVDDREALKRLVLADKLWLSLADLELLTGFQRKTIMKWHQKGWIRLFAAPPTRPEQKRERYFTTLEIWQEDEQVLLRGGVLKQRSRPSLRRTQRPGAPSLSNAD